MPGTAAQLAAPWRCCWPVCHTTQNTPLTSAAAESLQEPGTGGVAACVVLGSRRWMGTRTRLWRWPRSGGACTPAERPHERVSGGAPRAGLAQPCPAPPARAQRRCVCSAGGSSRGSEEAVTPRRAQGILGPQAVAALVQRTRGRPSFGARAGASGWRPILPPRPSGARARAADLATVMTPPPLASSGSRAAGQVGMHSGLSGCHCELPSQEQRSTVRLGASRAHACARAGLAGGRPPPPPLVFEVPWRALGPIRPGHARGATSTAQTACRW